MSNYIPASKRVTGDNPGRIWVQFSPQDTTIACQNLYAGNETVQGFFPWGINYDTTLQWLIDSGCKTADDVQKIENAFPADKVQGVGMRDFVFRDGKMGLK